MKGVLSRSCLLVEVASCRRYQPLVVYSSHDRVPGETSRAIPSNPFPTPIHRTRWVVRSCVAVVGWMAVSDATETQTGKLSDYVERRVLATVLGLVSVYGQQWPTTLEVG